MDSIQLEQVTKVTTIVGDSLRDETTCQLLCSCFQLRQPRRLHTYTISYLTQNIDRLIDGRRKTICTFGDMKGRMVAPHLAKKINVARDMRLLKDSDKIYNPIRIRPATQFAVS